MAVRVQIRPSAVPSALPTDLDLIMPSKTSTLRFGNQRQKTECARALEHAGQTYADDSGSDVETGKSKIAQEMPPGGEPAHHHCAHIHMKGLHMHMHGKKVPVTVITAGALFGALLILLASAGMIAAAWIA